jgi:transcriptional regulator with XRE-family HTH domain
MVCQAKVMEIQGQTLADRIKFARNALDFTQEELAEQAQIPLRTLQGIEYGVAKSPGIDNLTKIAKALNVSLVSLIEPVRAALPDFRQTGEFLTAISRLGPEWQRILMTLALGDEQYMSGHPDLEKLLPAVRTLLKFR